MYIAGGLTKAMRKKWTKEEEMYLEDNIGIKPRKLIANNLNRSLNSVSSKISYMHLGDMKDNSEHMCTAYATEFLGIDRKTLYYLVDKGKINVIKKKTSAKSYLYFFRVEELEEFKKTYKKQNHRVWTNADISFLKLLLENGKNKEEIAKRLDRTVNSIVHKVSRLGLAYKLK